MLSWALVFFVVALVAALLGLRGVAGMSAEIGYVLVVVAVIFLLVALFTRSAPAFMAVASAVTVPAQASIGPPH